MEKLITYIQKIKKWAATHPIKFAFIFGVITGFILKIII
jgi:hypothetical protein